MSVRLTGSDHAGLILALLSSGGRGPADELKAGAAAAVLAADDAMVIGGGIGPGKAQGQEGELRASAVVVEDPHGERVALVACDVLMIDRDVLDRAARRIEAATGIPFDHILINATHTHHAPTTVTIHGYEREEGVHPSGRGQDRRGRRRRPPSGSAPPTFRFRLGEESSVGQEQPAAAGRRHDLLGRAARRRRPADRAVRPRAARLAFRRPDGALEAVLFNHSTHTIGTHKPGVRSPSFYGLAAQELEKEKGGTFLFFEGASGSTHNLDVTAAEATFRIRQAVDRRRSEQARTGRSIGSGRPARRSTVRVRQFDEAKDERRSPPTARSGSPTRRPPSRSSRSSATCGRSSRPSRARSRKTWVQAIVIGDVALVGVPGEFFTVLGQEIKRRSPYRYTYVFELANDYIGYIPDRPASTGAATRSGRACTASSSGGPAR